MDRFVQEFQVVSLNPNIAMKGGIYRRDYGKSHGLGLADASIAASTENNALRLVTLNKKHYPMLQKILVPYKDLNLSRTLDQIACILNTNRCILSF